MPELNQTDPAMSNSHPYPAAFRGIGPLLDVLIAASGAAAKAATKTYRASRRKAGYAALRPGPDTPLWNELARACAQELTRYGEKAKLARLLGIPRQRLHMLLVAKSACPDAERTLLLLGWLAAKHRGADPA